jgi:hypothetical protein
MSPNQKDRSVADAGIAVGNVQSDDQALLAVQVRIPYDGAACDAALQCCWQRHFSEQTHLDGCLYILERRDWIVYMAR